MTKELNKAIMTKSKAKNLYGPYMALKIFLAYKK